MAERRQAIAVDGKTIRGSKTTGGQPTQLFAGYDHRHGLVLTQTAIVGGDEVAAYATTLDTLPDLRDVLITADAAAKTASGVRKTPAWPTCRCTTSHRTRSGAPSWRWPPTWSPGWETLALTEHPARRWEPKRLRLLSIAGRLEATGRRRLLHLAASAPFTDLALGALGRLDALAAPG